MGQGRKKSHHSGYTSGRKRSITIENDNQNTTEILHYIDRAAVMRNHYESLSDSTSCKRDPTPFPGRGRNCQSCSIPNNMDSTSMSYIPTKKNQNQNQNKNKNKNNNSSPTNVLFNTEEIPFVSTHPSEISNIQSKGENYALSELITNSIFTETTIYQNNRHREITPDSRESIRQAMEKLLDSLHPINFIDKIVLFDGPELIKEIFTDSIESILRFLVHQCLYERIYGLSVNLAIIDKIIDAIPSSFFILQQALYESLLEYHLSERQIIQINDDNMYVKEMPYGQIHRLVELWTLCTNIAYNSYCSYIYCHPSIHGGQHIKSCSPHLLLQASFLLLSMTDVAMKYKTVLLTGILELFYMDYAGIQNYLKLIVTKWPIGSHKKMMAWMNLLEDLLKQCRLLKCMENYTIITRIIKKIAKVAEGAHVECSLQALSFLSDTFIINQYIVPYPDRLAIVEKCLDETQNHWNEIVQQQSEYVFDTLLDYMEA